MSGNEKQKCIEKKSLDSELDEFTTHLRKMVELGEATEVSIENGNNVKEKTDTLDSINDTILNSLVDDPDKAELIASNELIEDIFDKRQKREHRDKVIDIVKNAMMIQIAFMSFIILLVVANITLKIPIFKDLNNESLRLVIGLLKYFISATIVEIVGMLFFIVKSLFPRK